mmetsp:Transcript_7429/g.8525  ORF Transcript_7429/g.8525 Transcript_7429/m.8525 type:complete len:262 (-) Transcript_7429:516-1301(-)
METQDEAEKVLPPLGEDRILIVASSGLQGLIRHGTSLQVMAKASQLLNDEFDADPEKDWKALTKEAGFSMYYAIFENVHEEPLCALRAILDLGKKDKVEGRPKRFIIEYMRTKPESRSLGLAKYLTMFSIQVAKSIPANVLVLSLEDAASYWMENEFILENNRRLNKRLNKYTDTYLLKLQGNSIDNGDSEDEFEEDEFEEDEFEEDDADAQNGEKLETGFEYSELNTDVSISKEDEELQEALFASLQNCRTTTESPNNTM